MPNSYFALYYCKWIKAHLGTAGITKTPGSNLKTALCLGGCKYSLWVLLMKISISARSLRSQSQIAGRLQELSLTQLNGWDTYGGWRQVGLSGPFKPIPDFWMKTHKGILLRSQALCMKVKAPGYVKVSKKSRRTAGKLSHVVKHGWIHMVRL